MGNLLFSPSGRIGPNAFLKGMMILAIIGAVISLIGLVSFQASQILGYISFLLIIPLFFLLVKRSHDAGRSGCCLLYTSPSPRDLSTSRMPSSA